MGADSQAGDFGFAAGGFPDPFRLLVRETTASTNDDLRQLANDGAPEGLVLLAHRQVAGRGRRGAPWFSAPGESLAFSVLLRPQEPKAIWPRLSLAAGVAVAEAVESFGAGAGIKWPNDIWIGSRKVAGILVEAGADFAIVGIGINVGTMCFPGELESIATSLRLETGRPDPPAEVLAAVIRRLSLRRLQIGGDFAELLQAVRQRCVLSGHRVSFLTGQGPREGVVEGISPGGELLLHTPQGLEKWLQADEIRILD